MGFSPLNFKSIIPICSEFKKEILCNMRSFYRKIVLIWIYSIEVVPN